MSKDSWHKWYAEPHNRRRILNYKKWYRQRIRDLLFLVKGNKCETCGTTVNLVLHEPNGNDNNHSTARLTQMLDGKIKYQLLCEPCHAITPNFRRGYRK